MLASLVRMVGITENGLGEIGNIVLQFELEKNGILTGYPGLDGQAQSCCLKSDPGREVRMNRYGDLGPLRDDRFLIVSGR